MVPTRSKIITMKLFSYSALNILILAINVIDGAKILGIYPLAAKSHFTCNHAILKSLVEAGHEVTVITPFPQQASEANYTSIIDISQSQFLYVSQSSYDEFASMSVRQLINITVHNEISTCYKLMDLPEIRKIFNTDEKLYDVIFVEVMFLYKCYLQVAKKMKAPVIGTVTTKSWLIADYAMGNPNNPSYIPFEFSNFWQTNDFYGRARNLWSHIVTKIAYDFEVKSMLRKFQQDHNKLFGSQDTFLDMEPDLLFINNHEAFIPRPMNPNVIQVGGIQVKPAKSLPKNIEKFINEAKHGVILFSFGSVTRAALLPAQIQNAFKEAFAEIPQRVIWKFEEKMENQPENVMTMEWIPQRDILEHDNVKAFISHCGQGGTYEAIVSSTPIIAIPLFADQASNADILRKHGVAVRLSIENITKQNVLNALNAILNDTRYQKNMQQLSKVFHDRPMTPQQSVVYWTEYVLRHGGAPHLKSASTRLNWFQYFLLDVIGTFVVFLFITTYLCYVLISFVYSACLRMSGKSVIKNKTL